MKKIYILFIVITLGISANSQTTILSGLSQQEGEFDLLGNDLYIVQKEFNKVVKVDISQANPVAIDFITNLNDPVDIVIINGFAYVSETYESNITTTASIGKIRKFDLSITNPTPTDVLINLNGPWHMEAVGNDLHFLELNITNLSTFDRNSKISKIDVTNSNPTINTYISNLGTDIFEFIINSNDIYISKEGNTGSGKILKGNISSSNTPVDFLTGAFSSPSGMTIENNELYFSDLNFDLAKIDLTSSPVTASNILTIPNTTISDMVFDNSDNLYLMDRDNGEILKIEGSTLSFRELNKNTYSIYPNPVKDILNINLNDNNELKNVTITNLLGQTIYSSITKKIDVENLSKGIYILNITTENGVATEKIIKQ